MQWFVVEWTEALCLLGLAAALGVALLLAPVAFASLLLLVSVFVLPVVSVLQLQLRPIKSMYIFNVAVLIISVNYLKLLFLVKMNKQSHTTTQHY